MRNLLVVLVVILSAGCTSVSRQISRAEELLVLAETEAKIQTAQLQACAQRAQHALKCAAQCPASKKWHARTWNESK